MLQKDVAKIIGVNVLTVTNWEKNHAEPEIRYIPKIIEYLGYNPLPSPQTFFEKFEYYKISNGLSSEACAKVIGVDFSTLIRWKNGTRTPRKSFLERIYKRMDELLEEIKKLNI